MSSFWNAYRSGFSWHSFDAVACLLAMLGFAVNAPAAAAAHARFGLSVIAGVLALAAGRQCLLNQLVRHMRNSDMCLSSAQWVLLANSMLSSALIALVSGWAFALGLMHLPSAALIVVALCAIDINAHTFDPAFTLAMMAGANLLHFGLLASCVKYAFVVAEGVDSICMPPAVELVMLPLMMVLLQAQVSRWILPNASYSSLAIVASGR